MLRDVTVMYTPELQRAKIESVFGTESNGSDFDLLGQQGGDELFRLSCHVAINLNNLKLNVRPEEKAFEIQLRSVALHYLTEAFEDKFTGWRL